MLGGSNCRMSGGKRVKRKVRKVRKGSKGGADCKMEGGARKRKSTRRGVKRRRGGGLCVGNLHPFEASESSSGSSAPAPAPAPAPMPGAPQMEGGAKKRKSRKSRKAGPYAKFVKKHFASVQKKHPSWKATDCMKEIAKMWRAQKK